MKIYKKKCGFCGKVIEGVSEKQIDYNLRIHIEAKHKKEKKGDTKIPQDH